MTPIVITTPATPKTVCSKKLTCQPILESTVSMSLLNRLIICPDDVLSKNCTGARHTDFNNAKNSRLEARNDPRYCTTVRIKLHATVKRHKVKYIAMYRFVVHHVSLGSCSSAVDHICKMNRWNVSLVDPTPMCVYIPHKAKWYLACVCVCATFL